MEKVIRYKEGLRVIVEHIPSLRSVATGIWVGVGSSKESKSINGLSHFTEHMMFKGTEKMSPFEIAKSFENLGASINAFTSKECTCYYVKSIDESGEKCFELLTDIFLNSVFSAEELSKERNVVLEEINMVEDSPEDICYDLLASSLYGENPLGQTILGSSQNVKRFEKSDILSFIGDNYCADNIVVSFAGNITLKQADELVKKYLLPYVCRDSHNKNEAKKHSHCDCHKERIKDFEQSNIAISYPSVPFNSSDSSVQAIISMVLGGGMSSRLFQSIREELGLAYSVYSSPSMFKNNGSFNIFLNISPENIEKALLAVKREVDSFIENAISEQELNRAKTQLKSACVFSQENVQTVMSGNGKLLLICDEIYDIDKKIREIESVTMQQAEDFIKRIFKGNSICTAYVGKKHNVDFLDILK